MGYSWDAVVINTGCLIDYAIIENVCAFCRDPFPIKINISCAAITRKIDLRKELKLVNVRFDYGDITRMMKTVVCTVQLSPGIWHDALGMIWQYTTRHENIYDNHLLCYN